MPPSPSYTGMQAEALLAELSCATPGTPVRLGRYEVVGRLGTGGMGTVYDAIDRERGIHVALKALLAERAAGVELKREFRAVADLAHPHLAPVYELAVDRDLWFFTMERVPGVHLARWARGSADGTLSELPMSRSLSTEVVPRGTLGTQELSLGGDTLSDVAGAPRLVELASAASMPTRDMVEIRRAVGELALGIAALHDAGLRHGDIKPANVLVREDGHVVVVDFGLSRPVNDRTSDQVWSGGTPMYMPPEQLSKNAVGPESDWYAVGATLYRVLTGVMPFSPSSVLDIYLQKLNHLPAAPRTLLPDIPADLSDLCMALLNPAPGERPGRETLLRVASAGDVAPPTSGRRQAPFVGRDAELCRLEQAYGTARGGELVVVRISGPSGIGKSALLTNFLGAVNDVDDALVLRGRCYERENVPYKAFDRILDALAEALSTMDIHRVGAWLPAWTAELAAVFPVLASVPAVVSRVANVDVPPDALEVRRRGWAALRELFAAIRKTRSVVIAIDDLQWADDDSAQLLGAIVTESDREGSPPPILVICLQRSEEAEQNLALRAFEERCGELAERGRLVELEVARLREQDALRLARAALEAAGAVVTDERLSFVAEDAQGLPFFIEELAHFIGTLGDEEALDEAGGLSLDAAVLARVKALEPEQRALMEVVAVANTPLPQSLLFEAASLEADALMPLLALRRATLVNWLGAGADDPVAAYHDRIRESVVHALSEERRLACHLALGRAFEKRQRRDGASAWLFDAVRHLRAAAPLLTNTEERDAAARMHLRAGAEARRGAAFPLAFACFEGGLELAGEQAWTRDYQLALELHCGAVDAAYLSASWDALERHIAEVKVHGRTVLDQLVAWEAEIDAHVGRHAYGEAVDTGLDAVALLGVELPREPGEAEVGATVQRTLALLTEAGPGGLRSMKELDDAVVAAATRILVRVSPAAYFGRPMLLPLIACHLLTTSLERGVSSATPYALALFGIVLNTMGLEPVAHTWGQLALELLERLPERRLEAATRHIILNLVCCWVVPLRSVLPSLREVFAMGSATGDYEYAAYAAHGYAHNAMYAGMALVPLAKEASELGDQMRALGQVNALHVHTPFVQLLTGLTGLREKPETLNDASFDETEALRSAEAEGSQSGTFIVSLVIGLARFHFGSPQEANASFERAHAHVAAAASVWHRPILHQYGALAAYRVLREAPSDAESLRARIDASLMALRRLAGVSASNFAHRVSMVEAVLAHLDGDVQQATELLDLAIEQANAGSWLSDVALANELVAEMCSGDTAHRRLRAARMAYAAWGAAAKASRLAAQIEEL